MFSGFFFKLGFSLGANCTTFPINEWFVPGKPPTKSPKLPNETINIIIKDSIGPSGIMALSASSSSKSSLFASNDWKMMK